MARKAPHLTSLGTEQSSTEAIPDEDLGPAGGGRRGEGEQPGGW